jgi:hypothetical protein
MQGMSECLEAEHKKWASGHQVTRFPSSNPEIRISNLKIFKFARASLICAQESNIFIHF